MELWIRVQKNKKLIQGLFKADNLFVDTDIDNKWCIQQSGDTLGIYKSKQRALEILDEIHQRLIDLQTLEITSDFYKVCKRNLDNVYEMPKE